MPFIPRASETKAVVDILTSTEFDDETAMAKAIVHAVAAELGRRETFVTFPPDAPFGYGPYYSRNDAEKDWAKRIGPCFDGRGRLLLVYPFDPAELELPTCECDHGKTNHLESKGRGSGAKVSYRECGVHGCGCLNYTARRTA